MAMTGFEFATSAQIVFGCGTRHTLARRVAGWGGRALWVTGSDPSRSRDLLQALTDAGVAVATVSISGEPTVEGIARHVARAREHSPDFVVAVGGGSTIDAAKAVAALAVNEGDPLTYLEVIGGGIPLPRPALPVAALPTTAGAGAEVTRNAVLKSEAQRVKVSLRHVSMIPRLALVDPELTLSLPPQITADCGLDALTQVIEPFLSRDANPLTDALCREGMRRAARSLRRAFADGSDLDARSDLAFAALCGGIALANAKLGAAHGFAGPLGGMFDAPHGALCARLLPGVIEANVLALAELRTATAEASIARFVEVARILTDDDTATVDAGTTWIRSLSRDLGVRGLAAYGMTERDIDTIVPMAARASSMKGNPVPLPETTLASILRDALA